MDLLIILNRGLPIFFFPFLFCLIHETTDINGRSNHPSFSELNKSFTEESTEKYSNYSNFKFLLQRILNFSHLAIILSYFVEALLVYIYKNFWFDELSFLWAGVTWMSEIIVLNGDIKRNYKFMLVKLFWIFSLLIEVLIFFDKEIDRQFFVNYLLF